MVGTVGGLGTWFALMFKSAFALVGMGAYLGLFFDVSIKPVAITLTLLFMFMNIVGVKKTTRLQSLFVMVLLGVLLLFVTQGLFELFSIGIEEVSQTQLTPFMPFGFEGLLATIGLVFVSYAGLTQIASVAEEIQQPDRNIPLGMILSLITATVIYVLGVYVMVGIVDPEVFRDDLTPVATAAEEFFDWFPGEVGLILIVAAAISAFASTGNAGIMSAARYPLAMARDRLIWNRMASIGRFNTPTISIIITAGVMILLILLLNVEDIAKLASAFMLMIFGLLNLAVIVMRESKIKEYDPGFYSPFYPWLQIAGMLVSVLLIVEMGILPVLFTGLITAFCIGWYYYYAYKKNERHGAIYHVHARLGQLRYEGLEYEMRSILREKGLREEDPYEQVVARAAVIDVAEHAEVSYQELIRQASEAVAPRLFIDPEGLYKQFIDEKEDAAISIGKGVVINHLRIDRDRPSEIVLVRIPENAMLNGSKEIPENGENDDNREQTRAIIFLVSSDSNSAQHLRILAYLAEMIDNPAFLERWNKAENEEDLREVLLRDERFIKLSVSASNNTKTMIGKKIMDIDLPGESLVAMVKRSGKLKIPHGYTLIEENDELSIIGDKEDIDSIKNMIRE